MRVARFRGSNDLLYIGYDTWEPLKLMNELQK